MALKPLRSPILYTLPGGELKPLPSATAVVKGADGTGVVPVYQTAAGGTPIRSSVVPIGNGVPHGYVDETIAYTLEVTYEGQTFTDPPDPLLVAALEGSLNKSLVDAAMDFEPRLFGDIQLSFYGAPSSAQFLWPDGSQGTFLLVAAQTFNFVDKVNEYAITYRELEDTSTTDITEWVPSAGFVPVSDEAAAALVTRVPEVKTQNEARNQYVPSDAELAYVMAHQWGRPEENIYVRYVTGRSHLENPSTDDLIQWASHKWGIPTEPFRAQMHLESQWSMDMLGDLTAVSPTDYAEYPEFSRVSGSFSVYQSVGISQERWSPDNELGPGSNPLRYLSTAFNLDYCCAWIRFHLDDPEGRRTMWGDVSYVPQDYAVAQGGWFQPYPWRNTGQLTYVASIATRLVSKPWRVAEFSNLLGAVRVYKQPLITRSVGGYVASKPPIEIIEVQPPAAPTLVIIAPHHQSLTLTWTAPADDGGFPITGYRIKEATFGWTVDTGNNSTGPYTLSGLTNGETYNLEIAAINPMGAGPYSNAIAASPAAAGVPGQPTGVSGTAGNALAHLSWSAPASDGGSPVVGYYVVPYIGASAQSAIFAGNVTSFNVTGLTNGTTYTFKVRAVNGVGSGPESVASGGITPAAPTGFLIPDPMPVISDGKPVAASNEDFYFASRVVDSDPRTMWNSVYNPTTGAPQWIAVDLNSVADADKAAAWLQIENLSQPRYLGSAAVLGQTSGSPFFAVMRNYKLQAYAAGGGGTPCPPDSDSGWVDLQTITDNRRVHRLHTGLNLTGYGWFKIRCTAINSVPGVDGMSVQLQIRDVSDGPDDSVLVYGDSISMEGWGLQTPGPSNWEDNGAPVVIGTEATRVRPLVTDYSTGGWTANQGDASKTDYVGGMPHKIWIIAFGHNDAHAVNSNVNDLSPSGVNSAPALSYKGKLQALIDYAVSQGAARVIIPYITFTTNGTYDEPNTVVFNSIIDQVIADNPDTCQLGPDFHTFFSAHPTLLRDGIHPTFDSSGGLVNGLSGYGNYHLLWAQWFHANVYS